VQFTHDQKAALYSLIYNIGQLAFDRSVCKKAIENMDWTTAYRNWDWIRANGKVMKGLIRRRQMERELFFDGLLWEM
jgi:lysozyme